MCGILGQVADNNDVELFTRALATIGYRGPDHTETVVHENVILGHNRLSILDLDPRSHQPFRLKDQSAMLIFNGEIYNYKEIRSELSKLGHQFSTESDTEVVLKSYKQWKRKCFIKFHGMFALAVLDLESQSLLLARDRFGEKPLFYSEAPGAGFWFGSEIKAVKKLIPFQLEVDHNAIIDFLHFGYIPTPKTIFSRIRKIPPGAFLEYSIADKKVTSLAAFYAVDFSTKSNLTFQEKLREFNSLAIRAASEISVSDVSLGAFLSGGVDSSGSVSYLKKVHNDINTFTAGFNSQKFDESRYATLVASTLGVRNTNRKIEYGDFIESYQRMVTMYDEPHNDYSFIPTYLICKEAAILHTVMISGDGSDEIFCGYPRYHKLALFEKFRKFTLLNKAIARASNFLPTTSDLRRQALLLGKDGNEFFLYIMSLNFSPDEASNIYGDDLSRAARSYSPVSVIQEHLQNVSDDSLIQKQRYLDIKMTLADDMLVKVDRASMANSIEVRPFYLHPLLTDFAFSLEPSDLVTAKTDKFLLKKALEGTIPKSILYRDKMGFTFPLKELILTDLKPFFYDCIAGLPESLVRKNEVERIFDRHKKGKRSYVAQLHSLMNLGYWLKQNGVSC